MATNITKDEPLDITEDKDGSASVTMPDDFHADGDETLEESKPEEKMDKSDDEPDHPNDSEAVRAARRARRRSKKDLIRKTNDEKDVRLTHLQRENEDLRKQFANLDKRVQHTEVARFDKHLEDQEVRLEYAKMKMSEAAASGDGDAIVAAQELWFESKEAVNNLKRQKQQISQQRPQENNNHVDGGVQRNAKTWMDRNTWYKSDISDTDSKIAKQLDEELSKSGWDANSPEYWDELDNRLQKYLPHRYNGASDENTPVSKPRNVVGSSGRESSASFGGNNRNTFTLSPERVKAMKELGAWDNPDRKQKMIRSYAAFDKANRNN